MQLPEVAQLVDREVVAREVEQAVEKHRAMAVRDHEAVAVRPRRMNRIVVQMPTPQRERDIGHSHRHSRMPALRCLDRIHGERAERVGEHCVGYGGGRRCGNGGGSGHGLGGTGALANSAAGEGTRTDARRDKRKFYRAARQSVQ